MLRELLTQVHGYLTRKGDRFCVVARLELGCLELVVLRHEALDGFEVQGFLLVGEEVSDDVLGKRDIELTAGQGSIGDEANEGALELTDVGLDARGNKYCDVIRKLDVFVLGFFL